MAPEQGPLRIGSRKLTKKKKPTRTSSVQYPERLKEGDDANEDVATVKGDPGQSVNQSVFSMITKAGSTTDFHKRFDEESSDSEEDVPKSSIAAATLQAASEKVSGDLPVDENGEYATSPASTSMQQSDESRGIHRLPRLHVQTTRDEDPMAQSMFLPPKQAYPTYESPKGKKPRHAPVMSLMLEAQAEVSPSGPLSKPTMTDSEDVVDGDSKENSKTLTEQLKIIFGFENPEEVIAGVSIMIPTDFPR